MHRPNCIGLPEENIIVEHYHKETIEHILGSKTELLLYAKRGEYSPDIGCMTDADIEELKRQEFAEDVFRWMRTHSLKEIKEAWNKCLMTTNPK